MADEPTETTQETTEQTDRGVPVRRRGMKVALALVLIALVAAAAMEAWQVLAPGTDLQTGALRIFKSFPFTAAEPQPEPVSATQKPLVSVFTHRQAADLVSKEDVLVMVGRRPGDTSQALLQSLEQSSPRSPAGEEKPPAPAEPALEKPRDAGEPLPSAPESSQPSTGARPAPQLVETPIVHPREPGTPKTRKRAQRETPATEASKPASVEPAAGAESAPQPEKSPPKMVSRVATPKPPEPESEAKTEKYQLPGSLRVDVQNYKGAKVKWGMMVILDDSAVMAKKLKTWETSRLDVGSQLVSKLPPALTAGSKLAVRDFFCRKQDAKRPEKLQLCLAHNLYPWSDLPCSGLDEKLKKLDPGGETNPCAAAAYVVKSELGGLGDLKPRVLVVTAGAKRCKIKEVLAETDKKGARGAVKVDVLALGMSKRGLHDYTALTEKTAGVLMKVERPADLEPALTRYTKVLQTPAMKQMDVVGEKASFKIGNGEELTLAPGTYTVVLPQMPGLHQSKRTIKNVRIGSGQTRVLNVNITGGRVEVSTGKK